MDIILYCSLPRISRKESVDFGLVTILLCFLWLVLSLLRENWRRRGWWEEGTMELRRLSFFSHSFLSSRRLDTTGFELAAFLHLFSFTEVILHLFWSSPNGLFYLIHLMYVSMHLGTVEGVLEPGMSSSTTRSMTILQHIPFVVRFKDRVMVRWFF